MKTIHPAIVIFLIIKPFLVHASLYGYEFMYFAEGSATDPCTEADHAFISASIEGEVNTELVAEGLQPISTWTTGTHARALRVKRDLCTCGNLNCVIHYRICRVYCASTCSRRMIESSIEMGEEDQAYLSETISAGCTMKLRALSKSTVISSSCASTLRAGKCGASVGSFVFMFGSAQPLV